MRYRFQLVLASLIFCFGLTTSSSSAQDADKPAGKSIVLWISDDGFRGDYVDRGVTPFLKSLMEHGVYTKQLTPMFPSLTFPSHVCEATGVKTGAHGIVSNKWFDTSVNQVYNMPNDPRLLEAEPIWLTATRQGARTAVIDWPLAQAENMLPEISPKAAYFNDKFDPDLSDYDRLEKLVEVYRRDMNQSRTPEPLLLLMGYVHDVDSTGHKYGPDAPETTKAIHDEDVTLQKIVGEVADVFKQRMHPDSNNSDTGDALYVLITTDHGMDNVKTLVNFHNILGGDLVPETVHTETSGSLGNIYLNSVPGEQREAVKTTLLEKLRSNEFLHAWMREELPENWSYNNPTRTGDIVVSLKPGYDFTSKPIDGPTAAEKVPNSLKGMHGYDPAEDDKMLGFAVLSRWGSDQPGKDLGPVSALQLHPAVAKLLGIKPAAGAKEKPMETP